MFYPDIKKHISPSAFASWHRQRSLFVRSYFKGEKTRETSAMKAGKKIHALIEAGFIEAQHKYSCAEKELIMDLPNLVQVLGRPDSHDEGKTGTVGFVDYKTGKENHWTREELATDLKMLLTARLVLSANPGATEVKGAIEWFGTKWDGKELVPTGEPSICVDFVYSAKDLLALDDVILSTITEINEAYENFLRVGDSSAIVQEEDVAEYAELDRQKKAIEDRQGQIKERIGQALEFAGVPNFEHQLGTFYFTERKTYEYPKYLKINYKDSGLVLEDAEEIGSALSAAKKNYELNHDPIKVSKSLGFKPKKA